MGRLRFDKTAIQKIKADNKYIINEQDINKNYFIKQQNIEIEIGSGKGDFIIQKAISNPNINFVAIEKYSTVVAKILKKLELLNINNLRILNIDANKILDYFKLKSISRIYLNFSDPWPKERHFKRRLTSDTFLNLYKQLLIDSGIVEFKTDNDFLYNWTIQNLNETKIKNLILYSCSDIYNDLENEYNKNNIQTEYEKKFLAQNKKINKIVFKFLA